MHGIYSLYVIMGFLKVELHHIEHSTEKIGTNLFVILVDSLYWCSLYWGLCIYRKLPAGVRRTVDSSIATLSAGDALKPGSDR